MAGDWVKIRAALINDPNVDCMAQALSRDPAVFRALAQAGDGVMADVVTHNVMRNVTVTALIIVWCAANENSRNGVFKNSDFGYLDRLAGIPNFGHAMALVGWAVYDDVNNAVTLPNFSEYNTCGRDRAAQSNAERQRKYRERQRQKHASEGEESNDESNVTRDVTRYDREEKRREEKSKKEKEPKTHNRDASVTGDGVTQPGDPSPRSTEAPAEVQEHKTQAPGKRQAAPVTPSVTRIADVEAIFAHWQNRMNHPAAKLDTKRNSKIRDALKLGYSVAQLCAAIDGCAKSPHHMGQNRTNTVYDSIDLIFRSADKIDGFIKHNALAGAARETPRHESSQKLTAGQQILQRIREREQAEREHELGGGGIPEHDGALWEPVDEPARHVG